MSPFSENHRNIVFFGETGAGKSSTINLLLETGTSAPVSNDSHLCTQVGAGYKTTLNGVKYTLWDTRGVGEGHGFLRNIFGFAASSERELKKFLKDRHQRHEIDLLVYCVRGSRATNALVKYYNDFCVITRQLAAPVVILVTHLERAPKMEEWWNENSPRLKKLKMEFDDHVCITTVTGHARTAESRQGLVDIITKKRHWQAQRNGSYFGSPVQTFIPSAPPPRGGLIRSLFRMKYEKVASSGALNHGPNNNPGSFSAAASTRSLSYHTAESLRSSMPSSPVVEPPTPSSATTEPAQIYRIDTDLLGVGGPSQSSGEETSSMGSSLYSLFTGPHSSNTSQAEVPLQSCTDDSEDYLMSELPFRHSAASVVRRKSYASRHGSFGDIWECDLVLGESSRTMVAVKAVKLDADGYNDLKSHEKKLRRELRIWGRLQHRNIVPLLGIVSEFGPLPSMVSPWFCNGSLSHYLEHRRLSMCCLSMSGKHQLLGDIAAGLSYLHSHDITHGDLHSDNVLIDDDGRACLTDFGLSSITEFVGTSYLKSSICGGVQFADPALVQRVYKSHDHSVVYPTKPCDVYSFGGLLLHVLSEKRPYDGLSRTEIIFKVLAGESPSIPTHDRSITLHKSLIQKCWDHREHKRPLADSLVAMFARE